LYDGLVVGRIEGIDLVARLAEALNVTRIFLLSPPTQPRDIQEEVNALLGDADPQILAALTALLPLLRELSTRWR